MTSFSALRASVCIFLWCLFNDFARFGLDGTATWMEQLPGLDTAARMEQLPGWNNYLGSILRLGWNNYLDGTTTWMEQLPGFEPASSDHSGTHFTNSWRLATLTAI